jgi:hypothetical protein
MIDRSMQAPRRLLLSIVACLMTLLTANAQAEPLLKRHKLATVSAPDLAAFEADYSRWLSYRVRERGRVSRSLAASWGAAKMAGRRYVLMSSDAAPDIYVRGIENPAVPNYRPLTTWGWNSIEIIVDNPDALHASLTNSPFKTIGGPAPLGSYPTIRAFQVLGPSAEVLYLTAETGDRSKSILPPPNGEVGRIFIMVLAGPEIERLLDFYSGKFAMARGTVRQRPVGVLQRAQGLSSETALPLTTVRLAQHGNLIELDGYAPSSTARPQRRGMLPPGIASASFSVGSLDGLELEFIKPPKVYEGLAYSGRRAATARGPIGELVELIEEP